MKAPCNDGHAPMSGKSSEHAEKPSSGYDSPNMRETKQTPPAKPAKKQRS